MPPSFIFTWGVIKMKKPLWKVGDLVKIKHGLAIILKVHTKAGDGFHYLVSEGKTNKTQWLRETYLQPTEDKKHI